MKGISCCGDCVYYSVKKHNCTRGAHIETDPKAPFYDDCPLPEVAPVLRNPCKFCSKFEFDSASAEVDKYAARIKLACASYRYPTEEQFNFCPVCGRPTKKG